jgi:hypothetical protein
MMEWFKAGGLAGMLPLLVLGVFAISVGLRAAQRPTAPRMTMLRSLPTLIVVAALCWFGVNLWAVNVHLSSESFLKARDIGASELPFVAVLGVTEAGQALTLGGLMATIVVALRLVAELRLARAQPQT